MIVIVIVSVVVVVVVVVSVPVFVSVFVFVPVFVLAGPIHFEGLADEGAALALAEGDAQPAHAHRPDRARHHRRRNAEVDQGGDRHVAGNPRAGFEMQMKAAKPLH